jgi:hypothetical protein
MSKSALRWNKASGSTRRRVDKIIRAGERGTRRALSSPKRREFLERVEMHG